MCGITGFVGKGDERDISRMTAMLLHRGPDDQGTFFDRGVGLGHTRLSIIDLSLSGHQPMWNDRKDIAIIFNGEIYNFKELKKKFNLDNKYCFQSGTDTEVILHLYEEFGEECFKELDGMFAIAIYDIRENKLLLARDRIGEKPLYWGLFEGTFIFGSELSALLEHQSVKRELNFEALAQYLTREYVPTPLSIFKGIFKLEPAHYLIYKDGEVLKKSFWSIPTKVNHIPFGEAVNDLGNILEKSVAERLVADVPVGIFLSGGIDSSTIAYYAQRASDRKIKTFSMGFDEESFDESVYAKQVADFLSTDHYHHKVSAQDSLELISNIGAVSGEPFADPSIIPTLLLSKFTREKVTVALGGDGGDELLAGYPTFQAEKAVSLYRYLPSLVRNNLIEPVVRRLPSSDKNFSLSFVLQKFVEGASFDPIERHGRWLQAFGQEEMANVFTREVYETVKGTYPYVKGQARSSQDILNSYIHSYLMDGVLAKLDRASMHYALEVRAPFLGKEVVEFLTGLPYGYKLHGLTTKYLLKELMKDKLPKNIVYRKKKGFGIPVSEWLKKELKPLLLESLSKAKLSRQGIFNPDYVEKIIDEHLSGTKNNRKKLWTLLIFQLWYDSWIIKR
ncbi:MAG: asparagine synthase (glutamine-hydrolyzing) [bacterium]|nr:asparagine synthase (glutamine-hydrolyzing) [bacterium]